VLRAVQAIGQKVHQQEAGQPNPHTVMGQRPHTDLRANPIQPRQHHPRGGDNVSEQVQETQTDVVAQLTQRGPGHPIGALSPPNDQLYRGQRQDQKHLMVDDVSEGVCQIHGSNTRCHVHQCKLQSHRMGL